MNICKIVTETVHGFKKKGFVRIEFEKYNNYMLHIACFDNNKNIDDKKLQNKIKQGKNKEKPN